MNLTSKNSNHSSTSMASTMGDVRFDENITYHEASIAIAPDEAKELWYTGEELQASFQGDVRETMKDYLRRVKEGLQDNDNNYIAKSKDSPICTRGLELLGLDDKSRTTRSELYRSLVIKQYKTLTSSMTGYHAMDVLQKFASKKSQWATDRALALAREDAAEARQVYREAFHSKDGVDQGCGICPMAKRRSLRRVKRKSDAATTA